jgi:hypothetical protein
MAWWWGGNLFYFFRVLHFWGEGIAVAFFQNGAVFQLHNRLLLPQVERWL